MSWSYMWGHHTPPGIRRKYPERAKVVENLVRYARNNIGTTWYLPALQVGLLFCVKGLLFLRTRDVSYCSTKTQSSQMETATTGVRRHLILTTWCGDYLNISILHIAPAVSLLPCPTSESTCLQIKCIVFHFRTYCFVQSSQSPREEKLDL